MSHHLSIVPNTGALREQHTRPLQSIFSRKKGSENHEKTRIELDYLRSALSLNQKLAQDINEPLLTVMTLAELGKLEDGLNQQDCKALLEAAHELRDLLQCLQMLTLGTRQINVVP